MCLDETAKTMLPKKRIAAPYHFWFPGVLGFGIILGFRIIGFGFRIILGCRIIGFGFRITRFWLQNHPWFQNHSATLQLRSRTAKDWLTEENKKGTRCGQFNKLNGAIVAALFHHEQRAASKGWIPCLWSFVGTCSLLVGSWASVNVTG